MSMTLHHQLPLPDQLKAQIPLSPELAALKRARDAQIRDVFTGKDDRFIALVGPCSADNEDAVCAYINRLARVNEQVSGRLLIIPRIYTNKPRTTGAGYKEMCIRDRWRMPGKTPGATGSPTRSSTSAPARISFPSCWPRGFGPTW